MNPGESHRRQRRTARSTGHYPLSLDTFDDHLAFAELTVGDDEDRAGAVDGVPAVGLVLDRLLDRLPDDERDVVNLVVVRGLTMGEAARFLGWELPGRYEDRPRSGPADRKRVSRVLERAVDRLREQLAGAPWIDRILEGRVGELGDDR